jgi:endonuclease/exonuclease/phosphatase (EEP) superfamily protein YafD
MHARFRTRINPAEMAFTFWLVDIHTDPDEVPQELDALTDVFRGMQAARPDEDDVILLGDLNAGPPQFSSLQRIPGVGWAVAGVTTNTRRTKTYDNLVFARPATAEYNALEVSDHNPVWAAFHPCESRSAPGQSFPGMAGAPPTRR